MEIEQLSIYLKDSDLTKEIREQCYWPNIWENYIQEKSSTYATMTTKEVLWTMISEENFRNRSKSLSNEETGVWIREGDICFIDFGINYINEAAYMHFGLIINIHNNKALVIPMTSNYKTNHEANENKNKTHLFPIGKVLGMNKASTLFLNDSKYINTARIVDVKAHIPTDSNLYKDIKKRFHEIVG